MSLRPFSLLPPTLLLLSCAGAAPDSSPHESPTPPPTSSATADPVALDPPRLRLPDAVTPVRYDLELTLDPAKDTFSGVVSIRLEARRATRVVWIHAQDLTVRKASFAVGESAPAEAKIVTGSEPFVGIALPIEISPEKGGALRLEYTAKIDTSRPQGVYSAAEGSGPDDRYVYTQFEPLDARRAFPCFDEPEYKVPWKISIRVPKGHRAFSNAESTRETDEGATTKVDFAETPPLPSYLVAFVAGPFDVVAAGTVGREKKKLQFLVPRGRGAETRYAAEVTPIIIAKLEDYFGMAYPYSKLDVAVVPRYDGTMEHPGIVALGQPLTLIKPTEESLARKQEYANIASHELSHYWFGDYVTMRWWDDTWLNESFGEWMDAKITDQIDPTWQFGRVRMERAYEAMSADRLTSAKRMRQPVLSNEDILNAFDGSLTYQKGASVLTMMEHAVTAPVFQKVIRTYMQRHAWKSADAKDFTAVLREVAGEDAARSFETFLDQPGVPQITATAACGATSRGSAPGTPSAAGPKIRIEQHRYLPIGTRAEDAIWSVPVCVRYGAGKASGRTCTFLTERTKELPLTDLKTCPEWIAPNEEGRGYYISGYSPGMVDRIAAKKKAILTPDERATLLRDIGFLASNRSYPLDKALALVPEAAAGDHTMLSAANAIFDNVKLGELPEAARTKLRAFVGKTFGPRAKALGFAPKAGEDPDTIQVRATLLFITGLFAEDPGIRAGAKRLATKWLEDRKALSPDVVAPALAIAASTNDVAFFDEVLRQGTSTKDRSEKGLLLASLGQVTDKTLVGRALSLLISEDIELRESLPILFSLIGGHRTRELAYAFLKDHFDAIAKRETDFGRPILFSLTEGFCDEAHRADAQAFFEPRAKKVDGAERVLANTLERISLCAASQKAALPEVLAFLKSH